MTSDQTLGKISAPQLETGNNVDSTMEQKDTSYQTPYGPKDFVSKQDLKNEELRRQMENMKNDRVNNRKRALAEDNSNKDINRNSQQTPGHDIYQ